jgi:hypothetical protein
VESNGSISRLAEELQLRPPSIQISTPFGKLCPDVVDFMTVHLCEPLSPLYCVANVSMHPDNPPLGDCAHPGCLILIHSNPTGYAQHFGKSILLDLRQCDAAFAKRRRIDNDQITIDRVVNLP